MISTYAKNMASEFWQLHLCSLTAAQTIARRQQRLPLPRCGLWQRPYALRLRRAASTTFWMRLRCAELGVPRTTRGVDRTHRLRKSHPARAVCCSFYFMSLLTSLRQVASSRDREASGQPEQSSHGSGAFAFALIALNAATLPSKSIGCLTRRQSSRHCVKKHAVEALQLIRAVGTWTDIQRLQARGGIQRVRHRQRSSASSHCAERSCRTAGVWF